MWWRLLELLGMVLVVLMGAVVFLWLIKNGVRYG